MSNYTKEELLQIAEYLVEELRELDDGASTTTAKLAADCGYDDMDMSELLEQDEEKLQRELKRAASVERGLPALSGELDGLLLRYNAEDRSAGVRERAAAAAIRRILFII